MVMVVQPGERNTFDQRGIEYALHDLGIKVVRKTLKEIFMESVIDDSNELLM